MHVTLCRASLQPCLHVIVEECESQCVCVSTCRWRVPLQAADCWVLVKTYNWGEGRLWAEGYQSAGGASPVHVSVLAVWARGYLCVPCSLECACTCLCGVLHTEVRGSVRTCVCSWGVFTEVCLYLCIHVYSLMCVCVCVHVAHSPSVCVFGSVSVYGEGASWIVCVCL